MLKCLWMNVRFCASHTIQRRHRHYSHHHHLQSSPPPPLPSPTPSSSSHFHANVLRSFCFNAKTPSVHTNKHHYIHIVCSFCMSWVKQAHTHTHMVHRKWQKKRAPKQTKSQRKSIKSFYSTFHSLMVYIWNFTTYSMFENREQKLIDLRFKFSTHIFHWDANFDRDRDRKWEKERGSEIATQRKGKYLWKKVGFGCKWNL